MKGNLTSKICRDKLTGTRARAHIYIYTGRELWPSV